jgi:hypothetical protein
VSLDTAKRATDRFLDDFEAAVSRTFGELQEMREDLVKEYLSSFS